MNSVPAASVGMIQCSESPYISAGSSGTDPDQDEGNSTQPTPRRELTCAQLIFHVECVLPAVGDTPHSARQESLVSEAASLRRHRDL